MILCLFQIQKTLLLSKMSTGIFMTLLVVLTVTTWIGTNPPAFDGLGKPLFQFWWRPDEEQLYVWDDVALEWKLTGLMDFDRPPIVGNIEPLEHPKFPGKPIEQGDLWYNTSRLEPFIYWMGAWFPTSAPSTGFDGVKYGDALPIPSTVSTH